MKMMPADHRSMADYGRTGTTLDVVDFQALNRAGAEELKQPGNLAGGQRFSAYRSVSGNARTLISAFVRFVRKRRGGGQ